MKMKLALSRGQVDKLKELLDKFSGATEDLTFLGRKMEQVSSGSISEDNATINWDFKGLNKEVKALKEKAECRKPARSCLPEDWRTIRDEYLKAKDQQYSSEKCVTIKMAN